jgi:hypothetical protein
MPAMTLSAHQHRAAGELAIDDGERLPHRGDRQLRITRARHPVASSMIGGAKRDVTRAR